jgi:uncharacterized protein (DUF362 family)
VKPNIVSYEPYPTTTHPEVLEAVLKRLDGCEVVVGDAAAVDAGRSSRILQKSPLNEVCERYSVKLVNLYSEKMKTIQSPRGYSRQFCLLAATLVFLFRLKIHGMVGSALEGPVWLPE